MAPTGSSTLTRSKKRTARTTNAPAIKPIKSELGTLKRAQGAVMATSPANDPLRIMVRSGLRKKIQAMMEAATAPLAAAVLVVTAILPMAVASAAIVLPGLKQNQPNQSTKVPRVASAIL